MNQSSLASRAVNHLHPFYVSNKYLLEGNVAAGRMKVTNTVKVAVAPLSGPLSLRSSLDVTAFMYWAFPPASQCL